MEFEHELNYSIVFCVRDSNKKPAAGASQRGLEVYSPTLAVAKARKGSRQKKISPIKTRFCSIEVNAIR
jgi:hypothetical protein